MTIRYFIPDWDDRVDPGYDFLSDAHSEGRDPYRDDYYAHEIFDTPPYDGMLLSRATLDGNKAKREAILAAGSVHRYLRLPKDGAHQVLGDCGAFSYWQEQEPPYQTEEVLAYYQELGFDVGVSVDHLIFAEVEAEKERRWQLTVRNAEEFLRLHRSGGYTFVPVGVVQGWDPASYQRAARALVQMGYSYIAIGGLARTRTEDVLKTLVAIQEALPAGMQVHLFGVNRPEHAQRFAALGVTSFDSASRLRRAWMDGRHNYFLEEEAFTAIRIPEAAALPERRRKALERADQKERDSSAASSGGRGLDLRREAEQLRDRWRNEVSIGEARSRETNALWCLRAYDRGEATLDETHRAIAEYATLVGDWPNRIAHDYWRTLEKRPWKRCTCNVCQAIGVEVIIFRGNNRNRRRGFHNTWQLYRQLSAGSYAAQPPAASLPGRTSDEREFAQLQLELW